MKVSELIDLLQMFNPETEVVVYNEDRDIFGDVPPKIEIMSPNRIRIECDDED